MDAAQNCSGLRAQVAPKSGAIEPLQSSETASQQPGIIASVIDFTYSLLRPLLFQLGADRAHDFMIGSLARAPRLWARIASLGTPSPPPELACRAFGLKLASPIGLAAGLDKNGVAIPFWPALGFGFVEVGTVTAHAQPGNPKPRMFRIPSEGALINRAGFNNAGSTELAKNLRRLHSSGHWPKVPVGVNVGKSKITPIEEATLDYTTSLDRLQGLADYFVINVSSPNTPGLRELQDQKHLEQLLPAAVRAASGTPVLLKLAPDLGDEALQSAVELSIEHGMAGVIATNTTISRDGLQRDPGETGGMSGRPLWPLARKRIGKVLEAASGRLPVVGVGGVHTAAQVLELLEAGCCAVQLYTALIFEGPGLPARMERELMGELERLRACIAVS